MNCSDSSRWKPLGPSASPSQSFSEQANSSARFASLISSTAPQGPILVVLDADDDCPAELGPKLNKRAGALALSSDVSVVIPKYEFETWFLASAQSLGGRRGLRHDLSPPANPEAIRGAKEWLSRNMAPNRKYSPTVDQAALVSGTDRIAARSCKSFDRLCRKIEQVVAGR